MLHYQKIEKKESLPATIESDETAMLMPRIEAYVESVLVDIGDEVVAGQVLVRLSAPEVEQEVVEREAMIGELLANGQVMRAEMASANTQLEVGRAQLDLKDSERKRLAKLVSQGAIARQRLKEANSAAQSTRAMLEQYRQDVEVIQARMRKGQAEGVGGRAKRARAQTLASYLEIRAPFAGAVAERNVDPGNLVRPSNQGKDVCPLITLAKIDKLRAVFYATVDVAGQLAVGSTVVFVADDMPSGPLEGELSRLAGTYNEQTRMMRAEMDIENAKDPISGSRPLRPGSYGSASITLQSATLPVIPASALVGKGDRPSVMVVRDGVCQLRSVEIALEVDGVLGVAEGLKSGDHFVMKDAERINDGDTLEASEQQIEPW